MPCMISIVSRTCLCRLGKMCEALAAANSSGIQPDPTPTLTLPFERWSTVAISAARTPGARYGVSVMLMPMRTFVVFAASHGISGQPWNHSPREDTGNAFGNSTIMPNEYWSSWRSEASGTTIRSSVQTESKSSSSARRGEIFELLDRHLVTEVRQVQSELHERRPPHRWSVDRNVQALGRAAAGVPRPPPSTWPACGRDVPDTETGG